MAARSTLNRSAIATSQGFTLRHVHVVREAYRPASEAEIDLDWLCNESDTEMGAGSAFGAMLERASSEHELVEADDSYMHGKKPGVYGDSLTGGAWQEWVGDASYVSEGGRRVPWKPALVGGYMKDIWGQRPHQTPSPLVEESSDREVYATEMTRNLDEVLALLPGHQRRLLLTEHTPRVHSVVMRKVFGGHPRGVVQVVHLSDEARRGFVAGECAAEARDVYTWLEGIALRIDAKKPRAGELAIVAAVKKEMAKELADAYAAFEKARAKFPNRKYPWHSQPRRDRYRTRVRT